MQDTQTTTSVDRSHLPLGWTYHHARAGIRPRGVPLDNPELHRRAARDPGGIWLERGGSGRPLDRPRIGGRHRRFARRRSRRHHPALLGFPPGDLPRRLRPRFSRDRDIARLFPAAYRHRHRRSRPFHLALARVIVPVLPLRPTARHGAVHPRRGRQHRRRGGPGGHRGVPVVPDLAAVTQRVRSGAPGPRRAGVVGLSQHRSRYRRGTDRCKHGQSHPGHPSAPPKPGAVGPHVREGVAIHGSWFHW